MGTLQIIYMPNNYYKVVVLAKENYKYALFKELCRDENVTRVVVWICVPELPLELYNGKFLWHVGVKLGTMLKVDKLTSIRLRRNFLGFGLTLNLEYKEFHSICFQYGRYGHKIMCMKCGEVPILLAF
ncbi:hypothetical protein CR513_10278, partial [Mucuna pruriens]